MNPPRGPHGYLSSDGASYLCRPCAFELAMEAEQTEESFTRAFHAVLNRDVPRTCYLCGEPHGPVYLSQSEIGSLPAYPEDEGWDL